MSFPKSHPRPEWTTPVSSYLLPKNSEEHVLSKVAVLIRFMFVVTACLALVITAGCADQADSVRQIQRQKQDRIQSQSQQDHVGEMFSLLKRLVELNPDKAGRQITYHLNQWSSRKPNDEQGSVPEIVHTVSEVLPDDEAAERILRDVYVPTDVDHLRDCYLFRRVIEWVDNNRYDDPLLIPWFDQIQAELGEENTGKLKTAARLFDWTVRNIAYEPAQQTDRAPTPPALSHGMVFRGPGYRQSDYQTLWRGTGDALQRAGVFTQLCQQASLPAAVLAIQSTDTGELKPWAVGVLIGDAIYLFEPELGTYVPGPDQIGIATLSQTRTDASVMRRLAVPGFFEYPYDKQDVQQCVGLINLMPEAISPRMKKLQSGLTGERRMVIYVDVEKLARQWDSQAGVAGVRLWAVPLLAEIYRTAMEKAAERDPLFAFWYISRWSILETNETGTQQLARGRWRHLQGEFDSTETDDEMLQGARKLYLAQRAPEFEIADLRIDVELQKRYGIRRQLGTDPKVYDRQLQQAQAMIRLGKRTATYWLSLIQYEDGRFDTAKTWFEKRALDPQQPSIWEPAARYNLARTLERLGETDRAIELYKTDGEPQEHGNRIRARLAAKATTD